VRVRQIARIVCPAGLAWGASIAPAPAFIDRGAWFTRAVEGEDGSVDVGSV